jgi:hypothetical protein
MTLKLIDKEITGQSTAQLITQQLGALLKAEFDNQYNSYQNKDKFNVAIYLNNHGIYQKFLEDNINKNIEEYANLGAFPAIGETAKIYLATDTGFKYRWSIINNAYNRVPQALINILFTNATTDSLLNDGTQEVVYTYRLQLVTRANTNVTTGDEAAKLATDKMQELIFIISQIMTYYANMHPPLQLDLVHRVKIANYEVGQVQEYNSVDKNIGCSLDLEIKARENPLLSTANDLQGFNMELDYDNKIINLTIDT